MATMHAVKRASPPVKQEVPGPGETKPRKFIAGLLNPACKHAWVPLDDEFQTLAAEGKIIWKCRDCSEITNTYDWRTP